MGTDGAQSGDNSANVVNVSQTKIDVNNIHSSLLCVGTLLKVIFLIFFALTILTFPINEIKQWAARK